MCNMALNESLLAILRVTLRVKLRVKLKVNLRVKLRVKSTLLLRVASYVIVEHKEVN